MKNRLEILKARIRIVAEYIDKLYLHGKSCQGLTVETNNRMSYNRLEGNN